MKSIKKAMYLAALGAAASSSSAWADWWTNQDQGPAVADGATRAVIRQQAGNTWEDWFWQGRRENLHYQCPSSGGTCTRTFIVAGAKTTGSTQGDRISTNMWSTNAVAGIYRRQYVRSLSTGSAWARTVSVRSGQTAQPVAVQARRWTQGAFNGAHFKIRTVPGGTFVNGRLVRYQYDWQWRDAATWTSNFAVGNPYFKVVFN